MIRTNRVFIAITSRMRVTMLHVARFSCFGVFRASSINFFSDRLRKHALNMANTKDFFLTVTQRLFSNWTALRLAVEHGMGPKNCAIEFCPWVTEIMYMNEKIDSSELAGELEDYMDSNFNTELEDNSSTEIANELLRFHRFCMEGNESVATEEFSKLPPLQSWILTLDSIREKNKQSLPVHYESDSSTEDEKEMDTATDEWVEVKARRKK